MRTAARPRRGSEYQLGRGEVPVDVCRPRSVPRCVDAPIAIDREPTKPIPKPCSGPHQAELDDLVQGKLEFVDLAGRYRLRSLLGTGGMARVFAAEQLALGRGVAVKVLDDTPEDRASAEQRFMAEARITARLRHPNVVEVIDFGSTPEGLCYLVMELLEGEDLRRVLEREGPLDWARARSSMLQLCAGLAAVHELGVVHRDLKPSNCFRIADEQGERIKLLDFGIALATADPSSGQAGVLGTPEYMSPEQARGDAVDVRTDIYALGVIFGELLTGKVPFTGNTASKVITAQIDEPVPSLASLAGLARVDAEIEAVYMKALSKEPAARFASVRELAAAIEAIPVTRELVPAGPMSRLRRVLSRVGARLGIG